MGRKKGAQEEKTTVRERVADALDLSKEVMLDSMLISSVGDRELMLENYKSILAYSETCIRIKGKPYPLTVTGTGLEIKHINQDLLYLTGRIHSIAFEREKGRE